MPPEYTQPPPEQVPPSPEEHKKNLWLAVIMALLVVAAGIFLFWYFKNCATCNAPAEPEERPLLAKSEDLIAIEQQLLAQGIVLPPDPGEAGKQTLQGIDSDGDGVRDDIQRYIMLSQRDNESLRNALLQIARYEQNFLLAPQDRSSLRPIDDQLRRSRDCIEHFAGPLSARELVLDLKAEFLNTRLRSTSYLQSQRIGSARTFQLTDESLLYQGCEF